MRTWFIRRLKEPSTWAGIVTVATTVGGFTIKPELRDAIIAAGSAIVGLLLCLIKEDTPPAAAMPPAPIPQAPPQPEEHTTPPPPSAGILHRGADGLTRRIFPTGTATGEGPTERDK